MATTFPFQIKNVTDEEDQILKKYYKGYVRPFVRVGPHDYLLPPRYQDHAADIYNLEVRPDDVWVISFSRSGTTWLQELTWLVANNLDYAGAQVPLSKRFAYIEHPTQASEVVKAEPNPSSNHKWSATELDWRTVRDARSPRYIKSHLPLSLLPPRLLTARVLYIARDIRDVAVSFFFMHKLFRYFDDDVQFHEFWELFQKNLLFHMPIFPHVEDAWQHRNHPNMLFLFYEEMQKDLRGVIDKVCKFFGKEYTSEQKETLANHLSFENMKKTNQISTKSDVQDSEMKFMRKGKSGGWVNYFDEQMRKEAEEYILEHQRNSDLRYPLYE